MSQIELTQLEDVIVSTTPSHIRPGSTLTVPSPPDPYVSPTLRLVEGDLTAEVIFVKAPAAVGKSITAQYLSARRDIPLVNLAAVPVATGSLQGLLAGYAADAQALFHAGELPLVVDALDEGRLLSGGRSLEAFLASTVAFLQSDRSVANRPKLILFGREESTELSNLAVQIESEEIQTCILTLDFFQKDAALDLIDLYARKEIDRLLEEGQIDVTDHRRRTGRLPSQPMLVLKETYFAAIERALELDAGQLWNVDQGRAFAGYAPVLASVGTLLASVENPVPITRRLSSAVSTEAWEVIDAMVRAILDREQQKLLQQLTDITDLPDDAYSPNEQLAYLVQLIGGQNRVTLSGDLVFHSESDRSKYLDKVTQIRSEHPFVRSAQPANDVLGSTIMAHAICHALELDNTAYTTLMKRLARAPFLWRAVRREISIYDAPLLDGKHVGYVLYSYWNDSMEHGTTNQAIKVVESNDGAAKIIIGTRGSHKIGFSAVPPLTIYGGMRDCHVDGKALNLAIIGATTERGGSSSWFAFQGDNVVVCDHLQYGATFTQLDGSLWMEAASVETTVRDPEVETSENCSYGWGGAVKASDPFRQLAGGSLSGPKPPARIAQLFMDCEQHISPTGIILMGDYSLPEGDNQLTWTKRYGGAFPSLMKLLVSNGLADRELLQSKRPENKFRVKVNNTPWTDLRGASAGNEDVDNLIRALVNEVQTIIDTTD